MSFYVKNIVDDEGTVVGIFFVGDSAVCSLQSANVIHRGTIKERTQFRFQALSPLPERVHVA